MTGWRADTETGTTTPDALSPAELAHACREAGLEFLLGVEAGWGKRELADWLTGPYQAVAAKVLPTPGKRVVNVSVQTPILLRTGAIEELIELVRVAVATTLDELHGGDTTCITQAIREGVVMSENGAGVVWVPADRPRMRLEARVLSLFVVDYLFRATPYATDLSVCAVCDHVSFDGAGRSCSRCMDRARPSHIRSTKLGMEAEADARIDDGEIKSAG